MSLLQAVILGLVQGVTEFFPISSSGHLILVPKLFDWMDQGLAFDAVVHVGTLAAVIIYFRDDIKTLFKAAIRPRKATKEHKTLLITLLVGTIPAAVIGVLFKDIIETSLRNPIIVAVNLAIWGLVLLVADWYSGSIQEKKKKGVHMIGGREGLFIGFAQALALIPGTSRSGITMTAGLFSKMTRAAAVRFSFLLSIPIIGGAGLFVLLDLAQTGIPQDMITPMIIGFFASLVGGLFAISALIKIVQKWSFTVFVWYRIILALLIVAFLL